MGGNLVGGVEKGVERREGRRGGCEVGALCARLAVELRQA